VAVLEFNPVRDPDSCSGRTVGTVAAFVTGRTGLGADDVRAWEADLAERGPQDEYPLSVNRYCFTAVAG
jgi:hypothetical protein